MEFSLLGLWSAMGIPAKLVVVVLIFLSVYSIAIMIERALVLKRTRQQCQAFSELMRGENQEWTMAGVITQAQSPERGRNCYLAEVMGTALQKGKVMLERGQTAAVVLTTAETEVTRSISVTAATLRKRLVQLASTSTGAPFVGLFGTILGLIRAFQTIATTGSGGLTAVAAGIGEALIATMVGLFVAIPALWAHNYFSDKIENLMVEIDTTASRMVEELLQKEISARGVRTA